MDHAPAPSNPRWMLATIPPAPREPSARARKVIFRYQGGQFVLLLVGGVFLCIGLLFTTVFCWGLPGEIMLSLIGKPAMGQVIDARLNENVSINKRHPTSIRFAYQEGGRTYQGESSTLDRALIAAAQPQAALPIEVVPGSPQYARMQGASYSTFGYGGMFTLFFPIIGGSLVFVSVRSNRREVRAFRDGIATMGHVTFFGKDTRTRINGRHPWKVAWTITVDDKPYTGSLSCMDQSLFDGLDLNQAVPVLYLPERPSVNTLYIA